MHTRSLLIKSLLIGIIVIFIGYAAIESRGIFLGPEVVLYSPLEGNTTTEALVHLNGQAFRTKELTANGHRVLIDLEGNFSEYVVLSPGYNIMTIVATDARGAQKSVLRHLYYKAQWLPTNKESEETATSSASENIEASTATTTVPSI